MVLLVVGSNVLALLCSPSEENLGKFGKDWSSCELSGFVMPGSLLSGKGTSVVVFLLILKSSLSISGLLNFIAGFSVSNLRGR